MSDKTHTLTGEEAQRIITLLQYAVPCLRREHSVSGSKSEATGETMFQMALKAFATFGIEYDEEEAFIYWCHPNKDHKRLLAALKKEREQS